MLPSGRQVESVLKPSTLQTPPSTISDSRDAVGKEVEAMAVHTVYGILTCILHFLLFSKSNITQSQEGMTQPIS